MGVMRIKARIDTETCLGYGDCVELAPDAFELGDTARVIGETSDERLRDAARACPAEAISLFDAVTGEPVEP